MKKYLALLLILTLPVRLTARQADTSRPTPLAFTHVTVIDMTGAPPKPDMTVVITGNRITSLGQTGRVHLPCGAEVVDATGKYLIPGLWDMHVHITETERSLPMFVANGVTGVRNTGGIAENLFRWRAEVASGRLPGPRIVACGPVVDGENPSHPDHSVVVRNAAEQVIGADRPPARLSSILRDAFEVASGRLPPNSGVNLHREPHCVCFSNFLRMRAAWLRATG